MFHKITIIIIMFLGLKISAQNFPKNNNLWLRSLLKSDTEKPETLNKFYPLKFTQNYLRDKKVAGINEFFIVYKTVKGTEKSSSIFKSSSFSKNNELSVDVFKSNGKEFKLPAGNEKNIFHLNYYNATEFLNFYQTNGNDLFVYEIMNFNFKLNEHSKNQVLTYLSLKYSIELNDLKSYVDSKGERLWKEGIYKNVSKSIAGIAKIKNFKSNIFSTVKYFEQGNMEISVSENCKRSVAEEFYFLIAAKENKSKISRKSHEEVNKVHLAWLVQSKNTEKVKLDFTVKLNEAVPNASLIFTDSDNEIIKRVYGTIDQDSTIVFKEVSLDFNKNIFKIELVNEDNVLDFNVELVKNCEGDSSIKLAINQNIDDYRLEIFNEQKNKLKEYPMLTANTLITGLEAGTYNFKIFDGVITKEKQIYIEEDINRSAICELQEQYFITDKVPIRIIPKWLDAENISSMRWYYNGSFISDENYIETIKPGNYTFLITFGECEIAYTTTVIEEDRPYKESYWTVYPNPVNIGNDFTVSYNLEKEANVIVTIYNENGKVIVHRKLGSLSTKSFDFKLNTSGVYVIMSTIGANKTYKKLIVK